jgi:hypothetical protein
MMVEVRNSDEGKKLLNYPKYTKIQTQMHMYRCVQTNNKSQWCYLGGYKNYRLPMDIVGHDFNLGGQLCEQPPKLYLQ